MKIDKHKVVVLTYELKVDGMIADKATEIKPLDYIQGCHMLIPAFEDQLEGKQEGDSFEFSLQPEDGYGPYEPKHRFGIPKSSFEINGEIREDLLQVGRMIPMLNGNGDVCHALIVEIKEESVTVDFNHPMAGKVLNFTGKILSVREATEKELSEGLHGEFLPQQGHGCGGGCHGCGGHGEEGGCCGGHGEDGGCCGGHDSEGGCCGGHGEGCGCHQN